MSGNLKNLENFLWLRRWQEILDANPGAKVVVTLRDADAWWASLSSTIHNKNPAKNGWGTFMHLTLSISPSLVELLVCCFFGVVGDVGYHWCAIVPV